MKKFFFFLFFISLLYSCKKNNFLSWNLIDTPEVINIQLKNNSLLKFEISANFKKTGYDNNAKMGFIVSKMNTNPTIDNCDTLFYLSDNEIGIRSQQINWYTNGDIFCRAFILNKI
ncbi:MAG: hypothetical protein FJZ67_10010, partial [Bacteroidetes bacterium]|nr:hypothetical protein [Bacteroidota bacterium]